MASLRESLKDLRYALGPEVSRLRSPTRRTLSLDLEGAEVIREIVVLAHGWFQREGPVLSARGPGTP